MLEGDVQPDLGIGREFLRGAVLCEPEGGFLQFPDILDVRGDIGAPVRDGGFFRLGKPDVPVDAAAGIPAGGFLGIVDVHPDLIGSFLQCRVQPDGEGGIAVGPAAEIHAVDRHRGVGHGAVDLQVDVLLKVFRSEFQGLGVGGLPPPGELPAFAGVLLFEGAFHAPVMG